jgi:hypothetical protein
MKQMYEAWHAGRSRASGTCIFFAVQDQNQTHVAVNKQTVANNLIGKHRRPCMQAVTLRLGAVAGRYGGRDVTR